MAGEEDKKDGETLVTQPPDQKRSGVFTHVMSPSDMGAVSSVLRADPKYYAAKTEVAAAVNRLKEAGVTLTDTAIIEEFERGQILAEDEESVEAGLEAKGAAPRESVEKESVESVLRAKIEQVRRGLKEADSLFSVLQKNIHSHFLQFSEPSAMTEESRMVEFGLLNPTENSDMHIFYKKAREIDFGINGEIGMLYKKLLAEKSTTESPREAQEFVELESICAHDLAQCVRVIKVSDAVLLRNVLGEYAKEKTKSGSGDLGSIRRLFVAIERAWEQGDLLQEDLHTRFVSKDTVSPEDQHETTLAHVLHVLKSGVGDERRGKISGDFTVDEGAKNAKVKLNEGALYFILRNIAYNPIRKNYIEATRVDVRVDMKGGEQMVVIEIEDDGLGVDPDMKEQIFEPGKTGAASSSEGVGMGLAYSDKRLQSMGIEIDIVSGRSVSKEEDPAKFGTKFVITIPIIAAEAA